MKAKADIVTLYKTLSTPYVLGTAELTIIYCCTRPTANSYMKKIQNYIATKSGKLVDARYITRGMLCEYEGWNFEEIKKEALDYLAATSRGCAK